MSTPSPGNSPQPNRAKPLPFRVGEFCIAHDLPLSPQFERKRCRIVGHLTWAVVVAPDGKTYAPEWRHSVQFEDGTIVRLRPANLMREPRRLDRRLGSWKAIFDATGWWPPSTDAGGGQDGAGGVAGCDPAP